jgi:pimeloyl-ACP methyl ester carboxylesterase
VIAPEYAEKTARAYDYSLAAHAAVLGSIRDACRRFNVDADRIYLSGHGMGGDAAFDIGMSHPDLFAGVAPISAVSDQFCKWYAQHNATYTAWYVVNGEFDRDSFMRNASDVGRMMREAADVVVVQFVQRGYESYFEEIHRLFEWMELHTRQKLPKAFEVRVLRASEDRFFWLQSEDPPASVLQPLVLAGESRGEIRPMIVKGDILPGNAVVLTSAAKRHTIWLNSDVAKLDQRLVVRLRGPQKFSGIPKTSVQAVLQDFRQRWDRQRIFTARIDLD